MDTNVLKERRDAHDALIVLHRQNGIVTGLVARKDGTYERFLEGELHCDDGPAITKPDGTKMWFRKGKLHREGAPAIEGPDGRADYWENGEPVHAPPPVKAAEAKKAIEAIAPAIDQGIEQPITVSRPISLRRL
ncbi:MAG: hypothetical protein ACAH80_06605 [Alphaproteobacteria bacterium]